MGSKLYAREPDWLNYKQFSPGQLFEVESTVYANRLAKPFILEWGREQLTKSMLP